MIGADGKDTVRILLTIDANSHLTKIFDIVE